MSAKKKKSAPPPKADATTTVDIVIRLQVKGPAAEVANYREALDSLASVMLVQAEDGLWSLGYENAEADEGDPPNEFLANFESMNVHAILIDGKEQS